MSAFTPEQLAYLEAHRDDSRVAEIHWVYSWPIAISILSTSLRLWAKKAGRNGITLDDWIITFATICLVGECASGLGYGPPHGMGRHVIVVSDHDLMLLRQGDYVFSHFYDIALTTVKLAILAFYHRVFIVPLFQKIVLATAAFVLCWGIGITVTLALVCTPTAAYWDTTINGKCLNIDTFTYFTNISNLITDIWIFLMPVPVIWRLQLPTNKKLLLCFIFSIGLATCVVSSIRLTVVLGHGSPDFTWTFVPLGAYSVFEPLGGILATNLPIIWHMYRKMRARKSLLPSPSGTKPSTANTPNTPSEESGGDGGGEAGRRRTRRGRFGGWSSIGLSSFGSRLGTGSRTVVGEGDLDVEGGDRWLPLGSEASNEGAGREKGGVRVADGVQDEGASSASPQEEQRIVKTRDGKVQVLKKNVVEVRKR